MTIICFLEGLKHVGRSKFKFVRIFNHIKYLIIARLENFVVQKKNVKDLFLNHVDRREKIIVSLTTFPERINECYYSLKTLFAQTIKPDRIVLWLAESQFPDHVLPKCFDDLIAKGLEVRYCDDLRSHKKYFYMLQEQKPNELVITFDDDIIYHPETIERALKKHIEYPNAIVCNEAKIIKFNKEGYPISYSKWDKPKDGKHTPNMAYSAMTGSGCMYPYGIIPKAIFDVNLIKSLAFTADDLWITFMAKLYDVQIVPTDKIAKVYTTVNYSQKEHLGQVNCIGTGNDDTIFNIFNHFPELRKKFISLV